MSKSQKKRRSTLGPNQQKILLLLLGGIALGLSGSPKHYFRVLRAVGDGWREIDSKHANRSVRTLHKNKMIRGRRKADGTYDIRLTEEGRKRAQELDIETLEIRTPRRWDRKWRVVMFDVPEKVRPLRDSIRAHLNILGFEELQKSVFVHPYECWNEIKYITQFYKAKRYVRFLIVESIDNESLFKRKFRL